ncbi:unnamed protein product, partial [Linum tenue]
VNAMSSGPGMSSTKKAQMRKQGNPSLMKSGSIPKRNSVSDIPIPSSGGVGNSTVLPSPSLKRSAFLSSNATKQAKQKTTSTVFVKGVSLSRTQTLLGGSSSMLAGISSSMDGSNSRSPSPSSPITPTPNMAQDNTTTPSSEFVEEENIEQTPDAGMNDKQRKRGRGVTRGLALHKQNERNGKKLEVEIDPMLGRSLTRRGSLAVSSELGQLAPDYVWPISKKGQRRRILDEVILRLEVKLNIVNVGDIVVRGHIWRQFMRIVKGRRSYYRKVYRRYNETAKEHKPRCLDQQIW